MASDELELARLLRKRIETALTIQNWGEGSEAKFAPLYLAEEIIGPRIYELCRSIFESSSIAEETSGAFKTGEPKWRILAILLYIKCSKSFLRRFIEEDLSVNDSKLPLDLNSAQIFLGRETGTEFHDKQFIFIPAILKEGQEQQYVGEEGKRRLPFLAVKRIGHGSFGTVYRVTVARGHYFPKDSTMGPNHTDREFAWKEFQVTNKRAYESELRNVGIIRETSYREELCVVLSYGSLRRDTIFGLYFDLAECDLNQYLSERSTLPRTVKEIEFFFRCFQGLLDALVFLHTALKTNTGKGVCLIHRDLKPSNILVFKRGSKEEVWKLSDFGESEVLNQHPTEKRRLFGLSVGATQLPSQEDSTNSSMRPLRTGPFLAPETKTKRESNVSNVRAKSDVWSMGCILTILLAFLRDGSRTIEEFQRRRTGPTDGRNDFFFVVRGKKLVLNDAVKDTLESLVGDIRGALIDAADEASSNATSVTDFPPIQPEIVEKVAREMISLLQNNVLIVEPSGRADSQKFAQRFKDNMALFEAPYGQLNVRKPSISLGKMFGSTGSIKNETEPPRTWSLEIPTDSSSCRFSNCGNYLAFFSAEKISLYVMVGRGGVLFTDMKEDAKVGRRAKISKCPKGSPWSGFDVNSTHLVTFTSGKHLDVTSRHLHASLPLTSHSFTFIPFST
ncbi:kinase-like domain-containing protein [Hyaloscypha finlandica]|nr:kinase-like domain-containing protein [Hyaloscypha finlandica]